MRTLKIVTPSVKRCTRSTVYTHIRRQCRVISTQSELKYVYVRMYQMLKQ